MSTTRSRSSFDRVDRPFVPDAWIDQIDCDGDGDGRVGRVGYGINFNRYLYRTTPPLPLDEIQTEIRTLGRDIVELLREVAG